MRSLWAVVACGILSIAPVRGQQPPVIGVPETVRGEVGRRMDRFLTQAAPFGFDGQVLVERDGELVLHKAYGVADRAARRAMTAETRSGIASMSKQFVAAAILRLAELGRVALGDSIARYLPDVPPDKAAITIHQLLTHTAGLRPGDVVDDFEASSRRELLRHIMEQPVAGPPGERWRYANAGYNLLAAIIEQVTGAPYEQFLMDELFVPAGMQHTGFWHWPRLPESDVAHAYRGWTDGGSPATWPRNWRVYGAGDIVSTVADLYRWDLALRGGRVLSPASVERSMAPHVALGSDGRTHYAYGLFVSQGEDGRTVIEHGGDWQGGYNGVMLRYPNEEMLIIVLTNARDGGGQWRRHSVQRDLERLARGMEAEAMPPPARALDAGERSALRGDFALDGGGRVRFVDDGTYVWITPDGQRAVSLLRDGRTEPSVSIERANEKTHRLLTGLSADAGAAYEVALTEEGVQHIDGYLSEWKGLVDRYGPLSGFDLLGSIPLGSSIETTARLQFRSGTAVMSFVWRDAAEGRLAGTLVRDDPMLTPLLGGYPAAASPEGGFVAWDLFRERGLVFDVRREAETGDVMLVFRTGDGSVSARRP